MSTRWTDTSSFASIPAGTVADADVLPFADVSAAVGSQQRVITIGTLGAVLNGVVGVNSYAVATTLDATNDRGHHVRVTAAAAVTIPPDLPIGWSCVIENATASDTVSIAAGSGVTILSAGDEVANGKWVAVVMVNTNVASVVGSFADEAVDAPTLPIIVACSDETTALTTGTGKVTFRMPFAFTLTAVRASVTTAPTDAVLTVDINEAGTSILSTKLTIDAGEKTSTTAAAAAVISDTSLADDAEITVDVDTVGSTIAGAGLKVTLIGTRT